MILLNLKQGLPGEGASGIPIYLNELPGIPKRLLQNREGHYCIPKCSFPFFKANKILGTQISSPLVEMV